VVVPLPLVIVMKGCSVKIPKKATKSSYATSGVAARLVKAGEHVLYFDALSSNPIRPCIAQSVKGSVAMLKDEFDESVFVVSEEELTHNVITYNTEAERADTIERMKHTIVGLDSAVSGAKAISASSSLPQVISGDRASYENVIQYAESAINARARYSNNIQDSELYLIAKMYSNAINMAIHAVVGVVQDSMQLDSSGHVVGVEPVSTLNAMSGSFVEKIKAVFTGKSVKASRNAVSLGDVLLYKPKRRTQSLARYMHSRHNREIYCLVTGRQRTRWKTAVVDGQGNSGNISVPFDTAPDMLVKASEVPSSIVLLFRQAGFTIQ